MTLIFLINIVLITLCVLIHYEIFMRLSSILPTLNVRHRAKVFWAIIGVLIAHIIEIWIFAFAYYICSQTGIFGELTGVVQHHILDYTYYSFVTYTSLGLGDILPIGPMRFVTGIESLIGLILIAWSASFIYFQMQLYWDNR